MTEQTRPRAGAEAAGFSLLVVDDEPDLRTLYELTLVREGYRIDTAGDVGQAMARLAERQYDAIITDMRLPDGSGLDLLHHLEETGRAEKALVITAYGSAENAVEALKAGAYDYLTKPVDLKQFRIAVASALAGARATPLSISSSGAASPTATTRPQRRAAAPASASLARMAGASAAMQEVRALIHKVARSMAPVLVQGESGTGKELVARAIHEVSARQGQPFVAVNCGAIPEQLLEAEFFGYRKGAFTGAAEDRAGFFQAASGGTLFLDEIGDLPLAMQSKLLRAIQERAVRPVGAVAEQPVDVRLLSATHKELTDEVQAGRFRQDLFYRLNVIRIRVPPLRERVVDLPEIAAQMLERITVEAGVSPAPSLSADALARLARYQFPGNVRELENLLHRVVALADGTVIDVADLGLPDVDISDSGDADVDLLPPPPAAPAADAAVVALPSNLEAYLDQVERDILLRALERHRFNRTAAGASLGLSLRQMRYRMARLNIGVGNEAGGDGSDHG
ncbi:sigma-54-dependent transcriptional regulator [Piscinibacter sakaiensis]|uniref:sigma-54-dependent transcriptional regulator n=1 Tax=Piscinibacter sakaiensis TaxID=1547922 RepID=UPI003AB0DB77